MESVEWFASLNISSVTGHGTSGIREAKRKTWVLGRLRHTSLLSKLVRWDSPTGSVNCIACPTGTRHRLVPVAAEILPTPWRTLIYTCQYLSACAYLQTIQIWSVGVTLSSQLASNERRKRPPARGANDGLGSSQVLRCPGETCMFLMLYVAVWF